MKYLIKLIIIFLIIALNCTKKEDEKVKSTIQNTPIISHKDSTITKEQIEKWIKCHPYLDTLSYFYQDSFNIKNPQKLLYYQEQFPKAQDSICLSQGLLGGYKEYLWITSNIGLKKNR